MADFLSLFSLHLIVRAITGIIILLFIWAFVRVMNAANTLEWSDLISTLGRDNKQHADWDKIGKGAAVILCFWGFVVYIYSPKMDAAGIALILAPVLAYLGGVAGYNAKLRSEQGSVTTTTTPLPDPPVLSEVKVVEKEPVAAKKGRTK